jgi:NAD(P)-dependent dehydrogenase (short-subunit alcohol dehydrogenase family)
MTTIRFLLVTAIAGAVYASATAAQGTPATPRAGQRVVLITGSTDGLGRDVALRLGATGAHVIIHGRNKERGDSVVREITTRGKGSARLYLADLGSLAEVRRMSAEILRDYQRIDVLINNAGIGSRVPDTREVTTDGFELRFGINYLSHYLLTKTLLPLIVKSAPSRVVNVASGSQTPIQFDDVMITRDYSGARAYGQSKLAMILHAFDLAAEVGPKGVTVNTLHPATYMATNMVIRGGITPRATIAEGADAVLNLVETPNLQGGQYFNGLRPARANAQAYDIAARAKLKAVSDSLVARR